MRLVNSIPERYVDGFKDLAGLEDDEFEAIKEELSHTPFVSSIEKLSDRISTIDVQEIFLSVGSLIAFINKRDTIKQVVQDIVDICEANEIVEGDGGSKLAIRLHYLLNNEKIYYASKADDLYSNYGNNFILCRVISDIRPVFDIEIDESPKAGIILHSLNIHYQSNEEPLHKNITLTLNSDSIKLLKEALTRAENKENSLKRILEMSEMRNLNE